MDAKWIDFFTGLGITTGGGIAVAIIIGFFGKQLITYFFNESIEIKKLELTQALETKRLELNKDLETHKNELNSRTEVYKADMNHILETHKSELSLLNAKHSRLHETQSQVIANLYERIVLLKQSFGVLTATFNQIVSDAEKEEKERIENAMNTFNDFIAFYPKNKIFFTKSIGKDLDQLQESYRIIFNEYNNIPKTAKYNREYLDTLLERIDKTNERIPPIIEKIEDQFRTILSLSE